MGKGDAAYACSAGKGNCTDFHSLFLAILRVCGIPGQFEIGAAFPFGANEGDITFFKCGYHC
ncbi:MAG: transglutaminase domain-containing protein [Hahellaceae bacterium]|nr:transglutaminase domain-containing protein [Hahellaceae bacterium]